MTRPRPLVIGVLASVVTAFAITGLAITGLTEILTGPRPRYYDDATHKWVTAPVTQTYPLLTSPTALSPGS